MESSTKRRVLIVANRTAATPDLLDAVKRYAREQPTTFALLIPDMPKSGRTDWTLELALPLLERAARDPVEGLTGTGGDPLDTPARPGRPGPAGASAVPRRSAPRPARAAIHLLV